MQQLISWYGSDLIPSLLWTSAYSNRVNKKCRMTQNGNSVLWKMLSVTGFKHLRRRTRNARVSSGWSTQLCAECVAAEALASSRSSGATLGCSLPSRWSAGRVCNESAHYIPSRPVTAVLGCEMELTCQNNEKCSHTMLECRRSRVCCGGTRRSLPRWRTTPGCRPRSEQPQPHCWVRD